MTGAATVPLQSQVSLDSMSQGPALLRCNYLTRRAVALAALALGGALAVPRPGHGVPATVTRIAVLSPIPLLEDSDIIAHMAAMHIADLAHQTAELIIGDLRGSGRVALVNPSPPPASGMPPMPRFDVWREAGADVLVTGSIEPGKDRLKFDFYVWDVLTGQNLSVQEYVAQPDEWRQIAHRISSAVYERFTGEKRDFG